jgi:hypothetical protein
LKRIRRGTRLERAATQEFRSGAGNEIFRRHKTENVSE